MQKNSHKESCLKFYADLKKSASGFYTCPKGFTAYVSKVGEEILIYTSLRVKGYYKKGKDQYLQRPLSVQPSFSPVITKDFFKRLMAIDDTYIAQKDAIENIHNTYGEMLHDIRKICAHIKNKCEDIIELDESVEKVSAHCDTFDILQKIKNIEALSGIAVSRFEAYDISMNPETICFGTRRNRVIYQKFHKAKYMLTGYLNKDVNIQLEGHSTFEFPVYQTFDVLPFILLENAVKYAIERSDVTVSFREEHNNLYISVISKGPFSPPDEIPKLLQSGVRGKNAQATKIHGQGLGLTLVKDICDAHAITLRIKSVFKESVRGIPYGDFEVSLTFFRQ